MATSIRTIVAREGLRRAVLYAVCRFVQRFVILDITYVMIQDAQKTSIRDCGLDVECRFLRADEVRQFATDRTNDMDSALADRLETGYDYCFAGLHGGRLVSYCWIARHSIEPQHNLAAGSTASGIAFSYPPDHAFRYKGFTHPEFRGRRLYQCVGAAASLAMQAEGVQYLISTTEVVNYSAIRSSQRAGYEVIGWAYLLEVGKWSIVRGPDLSSRGILIGDQANVFDRTARTSPAVDALDSNRLDGVPAETVATAD